MKLNGLIYLYCPKESDLKNREVLREHLRQPTAGRIFIQSDEDHSWTIPFGSITQLISILVKVREGESANFDFTSCEQRIVPDEKRKPKDDRRCLRISIQDVDPQTDPSRYCQYLDQTKRNKIKHSDFADDSIGLFTQLDIDDGYRYKKMYFSSIIDAGIKLDKMFSAEVARRIPVEEIVNIL